MTSIRIGTRGSQLALYQANAVASLLRDSVGVACEIVVIKTSGDRLADARLSQIGGKRLFVKEIEDALLGGGVDVAVHSSKDMPAVLPEGLEVGAVLPREDPRDAVVLPAGRPEGASSTTPAAGTDPRRGSMFAPVADIIARLGSTPRIGTSSVRRVAQISRLLPNARFLPIRGNLDTRLRKLDSGEFDAIVLASAGLRRLGFVHRISTVLPTSECIPAPGQGIIAVEIRSGDTGSRRLVDHLNDAVAGAALAAERAVVRRLGGGCQMPIGAYATDHNGEFRVSAIVISLDGSRAVRTAASGSVATAEAIGARAADQLLADGAGEILAEVARAHGLVQGLQP